MLRQNHADSMCVFPKVACNVSTGPRPPMTTFKNTGSNKPLSLDLRDEGSGKRLSCSCSGRLTRCRFEASRLACGRDSPICAHLPHREQRTIH